MARRPEIGKREEVWTEEDLKEIMHNLALLSESGVREFYQRAYREVRHHQLADVSSAARHSGTGAGLEAAAQMAQAVSPLRTFPPGYERFLRNRIPVVRSNCGC